MMTNTNAHTNANANANTDDDDNIFVSEDVICEGASLLGEKVSNQLLKVRCRAFCYQLSAKTHWNYDDDDDDDDDDGDDCDGDDDDGGGYENR